jgi:hypothetical protein
MVGAVVGTPGTLPTNWSTVNGGLSRSVVAVDIENGLQYIDLRIQGIATATSAIVLFDGSTQIVAANGQSWSESVWLKLINASTNGYQFGMIERTSGGGTVKIAQQTIVPTSSLERFTYSRTLDGGATVAAVQPALYFTLTIGETYDFTIRIAAPQMELGAYATTFIPTTTAAVTRLADACSLTGASSIIGQTEGTFYTELQISQTTSRAIFSLDIGTTTNYIAATTNGANQVRVAVSQSSSNTNVITSTALTFGRHKLAIAYKSGEYALYIDGVQAGTSSSTNFPIGTLSQIVLASVSYGQLSDGYAQVGLYTTRLSNAELQSLTTL